MDRDQLHDIVRRIPLLRGFTNAQTASILAVCHEMSFEKDVTLFDEGDESHDAYVILKGEVQVRTPQTGGEIATIGENGLVGEMGLLTNQPRSATIVTLRPTVALKFSRRDLEAVIDEDRDIGYKIYQNVAFVLSDRLRDNNILLEQQYLLLDDITAAE